MRVDDLELPFMGVLILRYDNIAEGYRVGIHIEEGLDGLAFYLLGDGFDLSG